MITAAVWTAEDQSDLQWVEAELQTDGSYLANINVSNFDFTTGEYNVDVYHTDDLGDQYLVASTTGNVQQKKQLKSYNLIAWESNQKRRPKVNSTWLRVLVTLVVSGVSTGVALFTSYLYTNG